MNLKNRIIMEDYYSQKQTFAELGEVVSKMLKTAISQDKIEILTVEHRIKAADSLQKKLDLKGDKYNSLSDITDILGLRVICLFCDDVDKISLIVRELFDVDWENSVDKRAMLSPDSFGYLSLHYICSLKKGGEYSDELCSKKFEIQMRSTLQHTWSTIQHDMGYKSEFGVPRSVVREFARLAGLLEIADNEFMNIRDKVFDYSLEIKEKIANNTAGDVLVDIVSLDEYVNHNKEMVAFLEEIASICDAEISMVSPESYLEQLRFLGKSTIGGLQIMLAENKELALELAKRALENSGIDLLSSNVGFRFLCRAELLNKHYPLEKVTDFMLISITDENRAKRQAERLINTSYSKSGTTANE